MCTKQRNFRFKILCSLKWGMMKSLRLLIQKSSKSPVSNQNTVQASRVPSKRLQVLLLVILMVLQVKFWYPFLIIPSCNQVVIFNNVIASDKIFVYCQIFLQKSARSSKPRFLEIWGWCLVKNWILRIFFRRKNKKLQRKVDLTSRSTSPEFQELPRAFKK